MTGASCPGPTGTQVYKPSGSVPGDQQAPVSGSHGVLQSPGSPPAWPGQSPRHWTCAQARPVRTSGSPADPGRGSLFGSLRSLEAYDAGLAPASSRAAMSSGLVLFPGQLQYSAGSSVADGCQDHIVAIACQSRCRRSHGLRWAIHRPDRRERWPRAAKKPWIDQISSRSSRAFHCALVVRRACRPAGPRLDHRGMEPPRAGRSLRTSPMKIRHPGSRPARACGRSSRQIVAASGKYCDNRIDHHRVEALAGRGAASEWPDRTPAAMARPSRPCIQRPDALAMATPRDRSEADIGLARAAPPG